MKCGARLETLKPSLRTAYVLSISFQASIATYLSLASVLAMPLAPAPAWLAASW